MYKVCFYTSKSRRKVAHKLLSSIFCNIHNRQCSHIKNLYCKVCVRPSGNLDERVSHVTSHWFTNSGSLQEGSIFSFQFRKIITLDRRIGYNFNVKRQSSCFKQVFNPVMVDNYAAYFNCKPVGRALDSKGIHFRDVGAGACCLLLGPPGFNWCFLLLRIFSNLFGAQGSPSSGSLLNL